MSKFWNDKMTKISFYLSMLTMMTHGIVMMMESTIMSIEKLIKYQQEISSNKKDSGGGQVVILLAFYYDDPYSNPTEINCFRCLNWQLGIKKKPYIRCVLYKRQASEISNFKVRTVVGFRTLRLEVESLPPLKCQSHKRTKRHEWT